MMPISKEVLEAAEDLNTYIKELEADNKNILSNYAVLQALNIRLEATIEKRDATIEALRKAAQDVVDDGRPDDTGGQYRVDNEIFEGLAMLTHPEIYMEKK